MPSSHPPDLPSGADIQELLSNVSATNEKVNDLLAYWKDLLSSGLETAKKFDTDYTYVLNSSCLLPSHFLVHSSS